MAFLVMFVGYVIVVIEFAIEGNTEEFCGSGQFYCGVVYHQRSEIPFLIPGEHNYFSFEGADGEVLGCAPIHDGVQSFLGAIPNDIKIVAFCEGDYVICEGLEVSGGVFGCEVEEIVDHQVPEEWGKDSSLWASSFYPDGLG